MVLPIGIPAAVSALSTPHHAVVPAPEIAVEGDGPGNRAVTSQESTDESHDSPVSEPCLARTICSLKASMKGRHRSNWTYDRCREIARAVLASSHRHRLNPALLLAVMINESSMDERAVATTTRKDGGEARDSGLMGIRCLLDRRGRCTNGGVRGRSWAAVMEPATNIELGAQELARWRAGGALERVTVQKPDGEGGVVEQHKLVPCHHKTHAYWAHYNHGPIYIQKGYARHYPHRVAVLYYALSRAMGIEAPELANRRITINDPGTRPRTADRPMEERYRQLCSLIDATRGSCGEMLSLRDGSSRAH